MRLLGQQAKAETEADAEAGIGISLLNWTLCWQPLEYACGQLCLSFGFDLYPTCCCCWRQPLNRSTTQPPNHSTTQLLIYLCAARWVQHCAWLLLPRGIRVLIVWLLQPPGSAMPPLLSASARPLAAGILIKLKWCCKIYFISHSSQAWTWTWTRTGSGSGSSSSSSSTPAQCAMWEHLLYAHGVHINYPGKLHGTWRKLKCGYCQRECE